jgi:predicted metal-dependent enzyme (double-stranded beta helix superfamily)
MMESAYPSCSHAEKHSVYESGAAASGTPHGAAPCDDRPCLRGLTADLTQACVAPPDTVPELALAAVRRHCVGVDWLLPAERVGSAAGYCRHVLYADPHGRFTAVALVWLPGQVTPVHAHFTWCVYQVLSGALIEDRYDWVGGVDGQAHWRESVERPVGAAGYGHGGLEQVHRLRHHAGEPAISLHVYGIDVGRVASHVNRRPRRVVEAGVVEALS